MTSSSMTSAISRPRGLRACSKPIFAFHRQPQLVSCTGSKWVHSPPWKCQWHRPMETQRISYHAVQSTRGDHVMSSSISSRLLPAMQNRIPEKQMRNLFFLAVCQWCQFQKKICQSPSNVRQVKQISVQKLSEVGVCPKLSDITSRYNVTHI